MPPALRSRDQIALILNRPRPQQRLPVRRTGRSGKRRRQRQNLHALIDHGPKLLRKAQVIAHRQPQPAQRRLCHHDTIAWRDGCRFRVTLHAAHHLHIEQMHLVIAGHLPPPVIKQQTGRARPPRLARR